MDTLVDDGFVILGGPPGVGEKKFLLIIAAESEQAIEVRLANDPWTPLRLLRVSWKNITFIWEQVVIQCVPYSPIL